MRSSFSNEQLWAAVIREPEGREQSVSSTKIYRIWHIYILKDGTDLKVQLGKVKEGLKRCQDISTAIPEDMEMISLISVAVLDFFFFMGNITCFMDEAGELVWT